MKKSEANVSAVRLELDAHGTIASSIPPLGNDRGLGSAVQSPGFDRMLKLPARLTGFSVRAIDMACLLLALALTVVRYFLNQQTSDFASFIGLRISVKNLLIELGLLVVWRVLLGSVGLYNTRLVRRFSAFYWRVPFGAALCSVALLPAFLVRNAQHDIVEPIALFFVASSLMMMSSRMGLLAYDRNMARKFRSRRNIVIVGTGPRALAIAQELKEHSSYDYRLLGFIDSDPRPEASIVAPVLAGFDRTEALLMSRSIDEVIVALPIKSHFDVIESTISLCGRVGIQSQYSLDLFSSDLAKRRYVENQDGSRVVMQVVHHDHRLFVKRVFDVLVSGIGLILLAPFFVLIAILIRLNSKGPVFFNQERYGFNKRIFHMHKFRSMVVDAEAKLAKLEEFNEAAGPVFKMKNDPRVTRIGAWLRRWSLDELPQLWNVFIGDMSLVGPRPLPMRDVSGFSEAWLMRRFSVKPGITGLWQVSGRSDTNFDGFIALDLRYIDGWSLALDMKILAQTIAAVLRGRGAY